MRAAVGLALGLTVASGVTGGCGDNYYAVLDSFPIALTRAPLGAPAALGATAQGALVVSASPPEGSGPPFQMLVGTGTSMTLLVAGGAEGKLATEAAGFDLLDPSTAAVRATFRGVSVLRLPLEPIGDGSLTPGGVLGGDVLHRYSIDIRFAAGCATGTCSSSMTFWPHLGADLSFLEDSGYAVLRFSLFGGGEVTADGDPDFLGQRGPLVIPPTRVVLRACAVPADFTPDMPRETCCKQTDAERLATGVDLALMIDTGVGPLVLAETAWLRVRDKLTTTPAMQSGELRIATWPTPIPATWTTIPRFALVDLETGPATDPGPCVELGRARRIEQVSYQTVNGLAPDACTQPCDNDLREPDKSQNSAAYLELTGQIPVAIILDNEPYIQGLRFDVRPEGPQLDGVVGAGALGRSRVEIDYASAPQRALFSCEPEALRGECWTAVRCPRLPDRDDEHLCFGLPRHGLAATCAPSGC